MEKYALISVANKRGIVELSKKLNKFNYKILSTSNTFKLLKENDIDCLEISEYTGVPEMLDGRVKTLNHKIFAGLLADDQNAEHQSQLNERNFFSIDIVVCNFYDFLGASKKELSDEEIINFIDIGGISLVRAAAKNYKNKIVLTSEEQYKKFIRKLEKQDIDIEYRKKLAVSAFKCTYMYDFTISNYFQNINFDAQTINFVKQNDLAYGENPHQSAELINTGYDKYLLEQLHGVAISYNNILDINAALHLIENFNSEICCAIFKHTTPCGAAIGVNCAEAYVKALKCDPVSAYGGIVVFNRKVDERAAEYIVKNFTEVVISPEFSEKAIEILSQKPRLRIISYRLNNKSELEFKNTYVGIVSQRSDFFDESEFNYNSVTSVAVAPENYNNIKLGLKVCKCVKSNAIVLASNDMIIGIGTGQPNRVDSVRIAINNAEKFEFSLENGVMISDGFFPFSDSIEFIKNYGIKTVVQPGGSKRDQEVIDACEKYKISLVLTGKRHFLH